jgi:hypothetical protein
MIWWGFYYKDAAPTVLDCKVSWSAAFIPLHRSEPTGSRFVKGARTLKRHKCRAPGTVSGCALCDMENLVERSPSSRPSPPGRRRNLARSWLVFDPFARSAAGDSKTAPRCAHHRLGMRPALDFELGDGVGEGGVDQGGLLVVEFFG